MSSLHNFYITTEDNAASVLSQLNRGDDQEFISELINLLEAMRCGAKNGKIEMHTGSTKATGTFTFASVIATDVLTINGVDFTCVSSGASTNEFNVGASDTLTAAAAVTAINAATNDLIDEQIVATSEGAVITITALNPGEDGNSVTIASGDATITASGARLTGGDNGTEVSASYGLA